MCWKVCQYAIHPFPKWPKLCQVKIAAADVFLKWVLLIVCMCMCSEFYWANYATGLGAALHELGHTFDLAHSPTGVMSRGFDDIHRFFTVVTPVTSLRGASVSACHVQRSCSPTPCSAAQSPSRRPPVCQIFSLLLNCSVHLSWVIIVMEPFLDYLLFNGK